MPSASSDIIVEELDFFEEKNEGGIIHQSLLFSFKLISESEIRSSCPICLEEMTTDLIDNLLKLKCPHIFHSTCIMRWMENKTTCPVCRLDQNS